MEWQGSIWRFIYDNLNIHRKLRFLFQRVRWGFSDRDLWNFDTTIAKFMIPRLKRFSKIKHSYPGWNFETDSEMSFEEWTEILSKIINAFEVFLMDDPDIEYIKEAWIDDGGCFHSITDPDLEEKFKVEQERRQKVVKEGLKLFSIYFESLWD